MVEVDHHARTQHTDNVRVQDAGGQQVQDELALLGHNGMAGIVAALIARNDIGIFGQQVDDAALALIAPIDSSYCSQHNTSFTFFSHTTLRYFWISLLQFQIAVLLYEQRKNV